MIGVCGCLPCGDGDPSGDRLYALDAPHSAAAGYFRVQTPGVLDTPRPGYLQNVRAERRPYAPPDQPRPTPSGEPSAPPQPADRTDAVTLSPGADVAAIGRQLNLGAEGGARPVAAPIPFDQASAAIPARWRDTLRALASVIERPVRIAGFASPEGDATRNLLLSRRRADAVAEVLREAGVTVQSVDGLGADPAHLVRRSDGTVDLVASRRVEIMTV